MLKTWGIKILLVLLIASVTFLSITGCKPKTPESISVNTANTDITLNVGETLNLSGLKFIVKFTDQSTKEFTYPNNDFIVDQSNLKTDTAGVYTITVAYKTLQTSFDVTVLALVENGFQIDRSAIPDQVSKNYQLDTSKVKVYATYDNGAARKLLDVSSYAIDASQYNPSEYGQYSITVSYKEYTPISFTITIVAIEDGGNTLVLYSHISYAISGGTNLIITDSDGNNVETEDTRLPELASGDYTLTYTKNNENLTKTLKVVDYLQLFSYGDDYMAQKDTLSKIGTNNSKYIKTTADKYLVGTADLFYFDLKLAGPKANIIGDQRLLNYNFSIKDETSGTFEAIPTVDIAEVFGNGFLFKEDYEGKTFKVTITAKYNQFSTPVVFEFVLNDGYNVFTNEELKDHFGDLSITSINIHREIKAELAADQFNPDGSPKNIDSGAYPNYLSFENGKLKNTTGNVYMRYSTDTTNNQLNVNGNYFNINGQNLKLLTANPNGYPDQPGKLNTVGKDTEITNSQSAIFLIHMRSASYDTSALADTVTREQFNQTEGNKVTFNNLTILGNTVIPSGNASDEEAMKIVYENSGGYASIKNYTDIEVNNSVIRFSCIGIFSVSSGTDTFVNDCLIEESWANNIYGWENSFTQITNSKIRNAGGSAIWFDDVDYRNGEIFDTQLNIDNLTVIENYVAGTEAWFEAQMMSAVATSVKSDLEGGIRLLSNNSKTIIKKKIKGELQFETFNFAIVILDNYDVADQSVVDYMPDKQKIVIGDVTLQRTYEDLNSTNQMLRDPRALPSAFIAPVNSYSSKDAFLQLLLSKGTPTELTFGMSMVESFAVSNTKYVEVVLPSNMFLGSMTFITEIHPVAVS